MNLLLDTHVLLWWLDDPTQLSREAIGRQSDNDIYVSAASFWEIGIKRALNKLDAPESLEAVIYENDFVVLPITAQHALAAPDLPDLHRDPFDRMLIAQARLEGFHLVTRDAQIERYDVLRLRA